MTEQPTALRMADQLDRGWAYKDECSEIAAELRRLSAENEAFGIHLSERMKDLAKVEAQRDALLAVLKRIMDWDAAGLALTEDHAAQARAAIKAVEGEKK